MTNAKIGLACPTVVLVAAAACAAWSAEELPVLEKYTLDSLGDRRGIAYEVQDQSLGNGDARSHLRFRRATSEGILTLRVWRRVPSGTISFALLGERVEVRGFDHEGTAVYSHDLEGLERDGIHFGDSASGNWRRVLRQIPPSVRKLEVTYLGNYE